MSDGLFFDNAIHFSSTSNLSARGEVAIIPNQITFLVLNLQSYKVRTIKVKKGQS